MIEGNQHSRTLQLKDGRKLGYAEFGTPSGEPVFMFHGFPGSRLDAAMGESVGASQDVRLIAIDRPGFGLSDFKPHRTIADWPADVVELADALGIDRFCAMGISGGGPYAAACARFIPDRLNSVAIVAGVGPFQAPGAKQGMMLANRILFSVSAYVPRFVGYVMTKMLKRMLRDPEEFVRRMGSALPEVDRVVMARPDIRDAFIASAQESIRQGSRGVSQESALFARPWGFHLSDIEMEVLLFQGELDVNVPPVMGRYQASQIPNCIARYFPNDGHLSLAVERQPEILESLVGQ